MARRGARMTTKLAQQQTQVQTGQGAVVGARQSRAEVDQCSSSSASSSLASRGRAMDGVAGG